MRTRSAVAMHMPTRLQAPAQPACWGVAMTDVSVTVLHAFASASNLLTSTFTFAEGVPWGIASSTRVPSSAQRMAGQQLGCRRVHRPILPTRLGPPSSRRVHPTPRAPVCVQFDLILFPHIFPTEIGQRELSPCGRRVKSRVYICI